MATFKRFEDIVAWQKARVLTREIYLATDGGHFARDFGLRDQIRRSAVSLMANIAEGFGPTIEQRVRQFSKHRSRIRPRNAIASLCRVGYTISVRR